MDKQDVIKFIDRLVADRDFYKSQMEKRDKQIAAMKVLDIDWVDGNSLKLPKSGYNADEICRAFKRAKIYEGLDSNETQTVLDTFIAFLLESHHSLKSKMPKESEEPKAFDILDGPDGDDILEHTAMIQSDKVNKVGDICKLFHGLHISQVDNTGYFAQNLYLITHDEIFDGEWCINGNGKGILMRYNKEFTGDEEKKTLRRVISTTDKAIMGFNIGPLSKTFIDRFIKAYNNKHY